MSIKPNDVLKEDVRVSAINYQPRQYLAMYGLCCCCLELPCLKSLWLEYTWMGQCEIYGQMLNECFNLSLTPLEQIKYQICEVCITLLRNAVQFKQRVIDSQKRLEAKLVGTTNLSSKLEHDENKELLKFTHDNSNIQLDDEDICDEIDTCNDEINYMKAEESNEECETSEVPVECFKNAKAKKRSIKKNKMDLKKRKRKPLAIPKEDKRRRSINIYKVNYIKPRQNACLLLENSTIVPFKSSRGYFTCLYCNKQHVGFNELKSHIIQSHETITFKTILKCITRPHDRIKADVSDITCRICKKKVDNLELLVTHLTYHNVKFNFDDGLKPVDSILPYDLSDNKYKCYICKNEFLFFKTLSNHMNTHSSEFVCDVCGRCFLLPERLRAHIQMHLNFKSAKCDICNKICASSFALKSHIRYMHKKLSFICSICNEIFATYRLRIRHLEEVHKRAPLNLNCKICLKKYNTPNSLNNHMRIEHLKILKEPKFSCNVCNMMFKSSNALSCHSIVHSGEKKFQCEVCHKRYARAKTLTEHMKIHRNDRRWSCGACSQKFVQKCSLKNHIRVHHVDFDCEQLIVYKKPDSE